MDNISIRPAMTNKMYYYRILIVLKRSNGRRGENGHCGF